MTKRYVCIVWMLLISLIQSEICPSETGRHCCVGFKWNNTQEKCLPCDKGYFGINCSFECRFPWYGVRCMSNCTCSKTDCDHVYGCVMSKEANVTSTDDIADFVTVINKRKEGPFKINGVVYSLIGRAATSVLFIFFYLCIHLLEKCYMQNKTS